MSPGRIFEQLSDDDIDDMAQRLWDGTINRHDYARLAYWTIGAINACGQAADGALILLPTLKGRVTESQRNLLLVALGKFRYLVDDCCPDSKVSEIAANAGVLFSAFSWVLQ